MLNYLWAGMMLVGIIWGAFHGTLGEITEGVLNSTKEAVTLSITMLGIMSFWCGILKIAEESRLIEAVTKKMRPIIHFLFPGIPDGHPAAEFISINMIANMLGLGSAATPAGLKAMEELEQLEEDRRKFQNVCVPKGTANNEMCTFLIINISSLQLIPINMIAYRAEYGSADSMAIIGPTLIATTVTTMVGVIFCKIMQIKGKKNRSFS